jgi:hypothetical protein
MSLSPQSFLRKVCYPIVYFSGEWATPCFDRSNAC